MENNPKPMKLILLISCAIIVAFPTYAVDYIDQDIGDYKYENMHDIPGENRPIIYVISYYDRETNDAITVAIYDYSVTDPKDERLDAHMKSITKSSSSSLTVDGFTVLIDEKNKNVRWRSGEHSVRISEIEQKPPEGVPKDTDALGTGNFDEAVISQYLALYPSECDENGCIVRSFEEKYTFDEPDNLFWTIQQHLTRSHGCPKDSTPSAIKNYFQEMDIQFTTAITDQEIAEYAEECKDRFEFKFQGRPMLPEIEKCYNELAALIPEVELDRTPKTVMNILKECYIRDYFQQRFNEKTVPTEDYNKFYAVFKDRNKEFAEFVRLSLEYPNPISGEETWENGTIVNNSENEKKTIPITEEDGEIGADYEEAIDDPKPEIPSKGLLDKIKRTIKNFLGWFT